MKAKQRNSSSASPINDANDSDSLTFRQAVADAQPLVNEHRVFLIKKQPKPILSGTNPAPSPNTRYIVTDFLDETDEASSFVRMGQNQQVLRKLKRGFWPIVMELDLHGCRRDEAQQQLSRLLTAIRTRGVCARIIHGQAIGATNGPVLKRLTRAWLRAQPEVLAFCEAPATQGGAGALLVLFKNQISSHDLHE